MVLWCSTISAVYANPVGASLLAKAECQSTSMLADRASSRASSLPHWIWHSSILGCECKTCRSEPARDDGGSVDEGIDWAGSIASRLTPTMVLWRSINIRGVNAKPVGVSLLAMTEGQSTKILTGPAPSRAGSLLQWFCGGPSISGCECKTCRSEPARDDGGSVDEGIDWAGSIASRLTPIMVLWRSINIRV